MFPFDSIRGIFNRIVPNSRRNVSSLPKTNLELNTVEITKPTFLENLHRGMYKDLESYIRNYGVSVCRKTKSSVPNYLKKLADLSSLKPSETDWNIYLEGLRFCNENYRDPVKHTYNFISFLELKPTEFEKNLYLKGQKICDQPRDYIELFINLLELKQDKFVWDIYAKGLDKCGQRDPCYFTQYFIDLLKLQPNETELKLYLKGLNSCLAPDAYTDDFVGFLNLKPNATQRNIYENGLNRCIERGLLVGHYLGTFVELINHYSNHDQLSSEIDIYLMGLELSQEQKLPINIYTEFLKELLQIARSSPALTNSLNNFCKALDQKIYKNEPDLYRALLDLYVLAYEELRRRELKFPTNIMVSINQMRPLDDIPRYPIRSNDPKIQELEMKQIAKEIGEVYDFGLDTFYGFESLTQAARPFKSFADPDLQASLLERNLVNLATNTFRLNCSKEARLDSSFPGPAWYCEKIKIPKIQKQILESIPSEDLDIVGMNSNNFNDLETTNVAIARGGIILSNNSIKLKNSKNLLEDYSIVIYNDHFDNPTNMVMLLVPTRIIQEKINACKIPVQQYKKFNPAYADSISNGLDANSLRQNPDVFNIISHKTLRGGFAFNENSHEEVLDSIKSYQSIWRKLQLSMSLNDKGYLNLEKFNIKQIKPEFRTKFQLPSLLLNEVYKWREEYLNDQSKKDSIPVLVDADPFRYSDAKDWTIKIDPSCDEGIELIIRNQDQEQKRFILPDPPNDQFDMDAWKQDLITTWGSEVYTRVYKKPLTKALRFYSKSQI